AAFATTLSSESGSTGGSPGEPPDPARDAPAPPPARRRGRPRPPLLLVAAGAVLAAGRLAAAMPQAPPEPSWNRHVPGLADSAGDICFGAEFLHLSLGVCIVEWASAK